MVRTSFVCVAILWGFASTSQAVDVAEMDALFAKWSEESEKPGLAVAVIQDGKEVYRKCFGMANLEYGVKLTEKSVFDTASVAKQFTGFAVATLIENGQLSMDDPVRKYLPELNDLHDAIKVHHLVHHTSGLRDVANLFDLVSRGHMGTAEDALNLIKVQKGFNFEPGTEYNYSNSNYVLLALIVERITKQDFRSWCDENLFKKCGMPDSFANDNAKEIVKHRAVAYYGQEPSFSFDQSNGMSMVGSSAVYSTLADMSNWTRYLLETRSSKVTQRMMTTGKLDNGAPVDYAFGLAIHPHRGSTMVEHSGATPAGFRTQVAMFPDHEFALVLLSNWGNANLMHEYANRIIALYLGDNLEDEDAAQEPEDVATVELPREALEKFTGNYLFNDEAKVAIAITDDGLELELEGRGKMKVEPMSESRLYMASLRSFLQFEDDYQKVTVYELGRKIGNLKRKQDEHDSQTPKLQELAGRYFNDEMNLVFAVKAEGDALSLQTSSTSSRDLVHRTGEQFRAADWSFTKVLFSRGADGVVDGMEVALGNRLWSVQFRRMK